MQSFKDLLNESMSLPSKYAKNVVTSDRAAHAAKGQIGSLHYAHGSDFDVYAPDSHDLAYFGKNVVRLKGKTTGKEQAAYVDWQKGTVSFYSGNHGDDKDFDKPVKFKTATLFKEAEENLDLYNQLAEDLEVSMPIEESEQTLVKGKIYKAASNDMLLKYTGRSKAVGTSFQPVFTVVDSKGVPRLVKGKNFTQSYGSDVLKNLSLVEAESIDESTAPTKSSPGVKKIVDALKKKGFDAEVSVETERVYNRKTESNDTVVTLRIEFYEEGQDSEPVGVFTTTDASAFKFGNIYSKAKSLHNHELTAAQVVPEIKAGKFDPK